jgi:hypothetical protein
VLNKYRIKLTFKEPGKLNLYLDYRGIEVRFPQRP